MQTRPVLMCAVLMALSVGAVAQDQLVQSFALNNYKRVLDGQWQGIKYASDGNVYFASSTHSAHHGASFFKYDPRTGQITVLALDITTICGEDPNTNPQGKLHSDIIEASGWLYFTTYFGADERHGGRGGWTGSHLLAYELATGRFRDFRVIADGLNSYSGIAVDPVRNYVYTFVTDGGAFVYRFDIGTGAKVNLGQVSTAAVGSFYWFIDRRGDVWFSLSHDNGTLRRVRGASGIIDTYPNVLPALTDWDVDQPNADPLWQQQRWIFWMQPLDGDRAVFTMGFNGGTLYIFDSTKTIGSGQEFTAIRHIGYTYLGMALGNNRVFYYQRANRGFGHQEYTDFHLLSVSLSPATGYAITDHGLLKDQNGRLVWRVPSMATNGASKVFMTGDWWTIAGDLGTLRYAYANGMESYNQLPRGEFFAIADVGGAASYSLSVQSTPAGAAISGTSSGITNFSAQVSAGAAVSLTAPASFASGGTTYTFSKWTLNGADRTGNPLTFSMTSDNTAAAVYSAPAVTVSPGSASLGQGQTAQFTANQPVTWSINPQVGSIVNGLYTAPATITSQQSVTVTATGASSSATATVTLVPAISVSVSPASATLGPGQSQQFSATVQNSANQAVTWSINPAVGSISAAGVYTAPAVISSAQPVTVTARSVADSTKSGTAAVSLTPPAGAGTTLRINCGNLSGDYTDSTGKLWLSDRYFNGGGVAYAGYADGTNDPSLYQIGRRGFYDDFSYGIPVIPGQYQVTLKFAELSVIGRGQRVFHVAINGSTVLSNFDIMAFVPNRTALDRTFSVTAASGRIDIVFTGVIAFGTISAIEILPSGGGAPADVTPPVRSSGSPSGSLASGTTQATLSLATNESATCRYSTQAGTLFDAMINGMAASNGTAHTALITGLAYGQSYNYFVRCKDQAGNANTDDFTIAFQVAAAADITPPVRSNGAPSGTLPSATTQTSLSLTTNESAACRYSTQAGVAFDSMVNVFQPGSGTSHTVSITGLIAGQSYGFRVRCKDPAGNANPDDYLISFQVAAPSDFTPPVRSNGAPSGILPAGTTQATLALTTNEAASCRFSNQAGTAFDSMLGAFQSANGTAHTANLAVANGTSYNIYVRCRDQSNNANPDDFLIAFQVAAPSTGNLTTLRINAGGSSTDYTDSNGRVWVTDRYSIGGGIAYTSSVDGTSDVWIYQTGRYGLYDDFRYSIPVNPGNYRVTLKFAEFYVGAIGARVFHTDINGIRVLQNFDILREVPPRTALDKSFTVSAPGGRIDIVFTGVERFGIISGIEIVPAS